MKGAVGTRGRVTSLSESLLPPSLWGERGAFQKPENLSKRVGDKNSFLPFFDCSLTTSAKTLNTARGPYRLSPTAPERDEASKQASAPV